MTPGDIDTAIEIALAAHGAKIRVLRVEGFAGDRPPQHSNHFWSLDVPRVDCWRSATAEEKGFSDASHHDLQADLWFSNWLGENNVERGQWNCACLPHQFRSWWGDGEDWYPHNWLRVWELDVGDLLVMNQQVLVPKRAQRTQVAVFN